MAPPQLLSGQVKSANDDFLPVASGPLQSACQSLNWPLALAGARGRRSGRGWNAAAQPRSLFPPPDRASGAEETQAGRPGLPLARKAHQAPRPDPTHPAPSSWVFVWYQDWNMGLCSVCDWVSSPSHVSSQDIPCVSSPSWESSLYTRLLDSLCFCLTPGPPATGSAPTYPLVPGL